MRPQSGLQKDVLNLYKRYVLVSFLNAPFLHGSVSLNPTNSGWFSALRIARTKPMETRAKFDILIRYSFRTQASSVNPRQISAIEYLLRKGKRQLEIYEAPLVKDCYVSQEMKQWNRAFRRTSDSRRLEPRVTN
jgi:succinate dehydrogenase assembly factor 1